MCDVGKRPLALGGEFGLSTEVPLSLRRGEYRNFGSSRASEVYSPAMDFLGFLLLIRVAGTKELF